MIVALTLAVLGGTNDATHDAVVSLQTTPDAAISELCSGVVVAPRVVVTAGHCVAHLAPSELQVGIGPIARAPLRTIAVAAARTLPGFVDDLVADQRAGRDLGVVLLAEDAGVTPIPIARTLASGGTLVGFGQSSAADLDTRGTRRSAAVKVLESCSTLFSFGDATSNACHGDSGAPVLVSDASGAESVLGVVSWGRTTECDPPSYAVRLDAYADWLDGWSAGKSDPPCARCSEAADCAAIEGDAGAFDAAADAVSDAAPVANGEAGGCTTTAHAKDGWILVACAGLLARARRARRSGT